MPEPLISVVMPVRNGIPFLHDSIKSILNQTFRDFEFVILDDNSTDESLDVLAEWAKKDDRIRINTSAKRLGLAASSNMVIAESRAPLIARMDADDLCEPDRLVRQWSVLHDDLGVAVVGTLCDGVDGTGKPVRPRDRWRIVRRSKFAPFPHGSVMMRRSVFEQVGGYDLNCNGREDQDLFRRMARCGSVVTLPEVLYHYRYHSQNSTINVHGEANNRKTIASLYSVGAMRLWAGERPAILSEVVADKQLTGGMEKLIVTSWALWADLHPRSLRSVARIMIRTRDRIAGIKVKDGRTYEWRFE